jgi:CRP-like cAMP-binding protein
MKVNFPKGSTIIEEGARGSEAYIISKGKVEVYRTKNGVKVPLAVLGASQIFGEMGMIAEWPRSASVAALEDTEAVVVGPDDFAALSGSDPELFMFIIKTIFERLRSTNQRVMELSLAQPGQNYLEGRTFLSGLTPEAASALGAAEAEIKVFPFRVGRKTANFMTDVFSHNDLYLADTEPSTISRNHFAIECRGTRFYVVDRGSAAGTLVNGAAIGGGAASSEAELKSGENTITAGPDSSPHRFRLTLR